MENYQVIIANGGIVCYNSLAGKLSNFRTGGKIETLVQPATVGSLVDALGRFDNDFVTLGACTNTLIDDDGIDGITVSTKLMRGAGVNGNIIHAVSGESLGRICSLARAHSLSGIEELIGIPGSVGGAVVMNAGCFGREISELVEYVDIYHYGEIIRIKAKDCEFSYRNSSFKGSKTLITGVGLRLEKGKKSDISSRMRSITAKRLSKQPKEPSLGSVFRAVDDTPAGLIIDECGLKKMRCGGALVSDKHANFIINAGGATSRDYKDLVDIIKKRVNALIGVELKREVIYINKNATFDIE